MGRGYRVILLLSILLQGSIALIFALTLRYELKTSGLDGMVYAQLMHNALSGGGFTSSINPPFIPQHWLGIHFSPILYLLVPFYALFPHIEAFLVIGCYAAALAAWPIFLTARTILNDSFQALVIALLYLINPFVLNGLIWDFHEVDFAPLCIAFMLWAVVHRRRYTLLALSAVLLSIKEHYGLSVVGFGLLWAWHWREPKFGLGVAAAGVTALCVVMFLIIPYFNPAGMPMMLNADSPLDRFSWLTDAEAIRARAQTTLTEGALYAAALLLPLLLLPLGAFAWLLPGLADGAINLLSQVPMLRSPLSYHSLPLIPVLLIAFCHALKKYTQIIWGFGYYRAKRGAKRGGVGELPPHRVDFPLGTRITRNDALLPVVVLSACFSYAKLALPFSETGNIWELSSPRLGYAPEDARALAAIRPLIPAEAAVSAQENVLPHLRPQREMYSFPARAEQAEAVVLHLHFPYEKALTIFGSPYGLRGDRYFAKVESWLDDTRLGVVYCADRWIVAKRGLPDAPGARECATEALRMGREEYAKTRERVRRSYSP